jgi:hypothetical protein
MGTAPRCALISLPLPVSTGTARARAREATRVATPHAGVPVQTLRPEHMATIRSELGSRDEPRFAGRSRGFASVERETCAGRTR